MAASDERGCAVRLVPRRLNPYNVVYKEGRSSSSSLVNPSSRHRLLKGMRSSLFL